MSLSKVYSAQLDGLAPHIVSIETDVSKGMFSFSLIGLPDKAVEESKDRVSSALKNSGYSSHKQNNGKVVISLAPAEIKKTGPVFDLGIALGYLLASDQIISEIQDALFLGELSLNGEIKRIQGALPLAKKARDAGFKKVFLPKENIEEVVFLEGVELYPAETLADVVTHLNPKSALSNDASPKTKTRPLKSIAPHATKPYELVSSKESSYTLSSIREQHAAKRAIEIAAAGNHNILLFGPPGTGKTLLAKSFSTLLPGLSFEDAMEVTSIHSAAGTLKGSVITRPPFRTPHHTSSYVSIVGGGAQPKPGEITLAHKGVLFLDEFPEFDRRVIESLREPLEERMLVVSRSQKTSEFPADIILIAAMNPCPCGNRGSSKECTCSAGDLVRYERKLSGPLMDRIDLWVEVGEVKLSNLRKRGAEEVAQAHKEEDATRLRVLSAIKNQQKRYDSKTKRNAHLTNETIYTSLQAEESVFELLEAHGKKLGITARGYHRLLKVSRTIADLEQSDTVEERHVLEALQYRQKPFFLYS